MSTKQYLISTQFVFLLALAGMAAPAQGGIFSSLSKRDTLKAPSGKNAIVKDEPRESWDVVTALSNYRPFQPDNLLVKIDSPSLIIESDYPRIHGALALYPIYAAAAESLYKGMDEKTIDKHVKSGSTPSAFHALLNGDADLIFMARPSAAQLAEAQARGKTLSITPIGSEAFVFFVNSANPVDNLTLEQIRDIYSRKITRWSAIGGNSRPILPFQRPEGSGSQTAMLGVMGDLPLTKPLREEYEEFMGGIINRVADYRNYSNAIGYSFRYYATRMFAKDGIKVISVNGIAPTLENIQNGAYPFLGEFVIITTDAVTHNAQKLVDWFLSPQGQDIIRRTGYTPLAKSKLSEDKQ